MSTVSSQIQRAMIEANSDQNFPQIQATLRSGNGQMPERRWEVPPRRQGFISEEALNRRFDSGVALNTSVTESLTQMKSSTTFVTW